jgi:hypothetical protein
MYQVDDKDAVECLADVPQSSVGAPIPVVLSDEAQLLLAYYLEERDPSWDGTTVRAVGPMSEGELIAIVEFQGYSAFMFGPPNDEAFEGHPLASRGLHAYAAFEVLHSSWVRRLERMNSVHPMHRPEGFANLKHYVFAFHDSTFECVARGFSSVVLRGSMGIALSEMRKRLRWNAA